MSNASTGAIASGSTGDILALIDDTVWWKTGAGRMSIAEYSTVVFLLLAYLGSKFVLEVILHR